MTKIIIFLLACSTCELEKIELPKPLYKTCGELGNEIREATTTYKNATLSFNVYNLFDEESEVNINQISSTVTQGRTYSLTLKYNF